MSIFIYSRPVHSGKTTTLLNWCAHQQNLGGILMPDINGSRKIMDLVTKEVFDIECPDPENSPEHLTQVGRFYFYTAAFDRANSILLKLVIQDLNWLLIDEAGKLELSGKGFDPAIRKAIEKFHDVQEKGNLLISVRDYLVEDVIGHYNITNYKIIGQLEDCK